MLWPAQSGILIVIFAQKETQGIKNCDTETTMQSLHSGIWLSLHRNKHKEVNNGDTENTMQSLHSGILLSLHRNKHNDLNNGDKKTTIQFNVACSITDLVIFAQK